jgi:WD40 repeat protein
LEALMDIPVERTSSHQFQLQSQLLDLNFEYSTLGTDLQKQQQIEKSARQRQLFIEGRRAGLREDIKRLESQLLGITTPGSSISRSQPAPNVLTKSLSEQHLVQSISVSIPRETVSAGNSEVEEEVETGVVPQVSRSLKPVPVPIKAFKVAPNIKKSSKSLKRAADATITSNTRPMNPATILPRGSSLSPTTTGTAIEVSANDISFSSALTDFNIFSDERRQILKDSCTAKIGKTLFKPRSLVLYPSLYKSRHSVIGLTPYSRTGEGIHVWNIEKKESLQVISATDLQIPQGYFEQVEWVERDVIAVAPVYKSDNPAKYQMGLLRDCRMSRNDSFEYDFLPLKNTPHQKCITTIIPLCFDSVYKPTQMATGGLDHKIVLWSTNDITRSDPNFKTTQLKPLHTSAISALLHMRTRNILYSGGKDAKIFGVDLESEKNVFGNGEKRHLDQVQELLSIANHPDLLLAG